MKNVLISDKIFYQIIIDGVTVTEVENTTPKEYKDVKVFASDLFYEPADWASIRNLAIETQIWITVNK